MTTNCKSILRAIGLAEVDALREVDPHDDPGFVMGRVRGRIATACLALAWPLLVGVRPVQASPSARLVYSRDPAASSCPDEAALRRAVAARVGYDPFFTWAPKTVVVHIAAAPPHGFVARLLLVDDRGVAFGARELRTQGQCIELLDAAALGIAIAIDPVA
jgi:hypothetical protein